MIHFHRYGNWQDFAKNGEPIVVPLIGVVRRASVHHQQKRCSRCNKVKERYT